MAMSTGSGGGVASTPNVTPMVDVMLVLLIIFMVVTPALLSGFTADPPQAQNIKEHPEDDQVDQVLGIDKSGAYYLNKKPVNYSDIAVLLHHVYIDTPGRDDYSLYVKADKNTDYGKIIDVSDIAAHNGVHVIGLISDQKPGTVSTVAGDTKEKASAGGAK
jgi:biopolymer transport protein TolR